jgi:dephospho-CoA kinase
MAPRIDGGRSIRIGITGPIGCGKSTVAAMLAERGAVAVDADVVARSVRGEPAIAERIVARFGSADPSELARHVFGDETALRDLEAIVHPAVRPRILAAIEAAEQAGAPAVVIEAIKLVEGGLAELCDEVWLVFCDPNAQRERLLGRGVPSDDARRRVEAQGRLLGRVRPVATRVIDTSGSLGATRLAVDEAWRSVVLTGG